jgi:rare lipoprotein A (peptidoglycan hydrolase)
MTSRTPAQRLCACTAALAGALTLAAPATAATTTAATGGTGVTAPSLPTPTVTPPVLVVGGAITVRTRPATFLGDMLNFHGTTSPAAPGATVLIQTLPTASSAWTTLARARVDAHGAFVAHWRANQTGHLPVRAIMAGPSGPRRASRAGAPESSQTGQVAVYRAAIATYFGPGLYGQPTACGQTLTPDLIGVAHRTLPCGTKVEVNYDGRSLVVPVVDRGPYANGADWDLTAGTATALGINETETIGTILTTAALTPVSPANPTSPLNAAYEQTTGGVVGG